jgi:uncharacterized membrane protein SirB2
MWLSYSHNMRALFLHLMGIVSVYLFRHHTINKNSNNRQWLVATFFKVVIYIPHLHILCAAISVVGFIFVADDFTSRLSVNSEPTNIHLIYIPP